MARIHIPLPQFFPFQTTFPVRITDINYGGHVGNDTVLSYLHEARMRYLQSFGYTELNVEGIGLIMSDVAIEFKAELFYGDSITAHVAATEFGRVGFELYYQLVNGNNTILATAKTGMVCFDYSRKKIAPLPQAAREKLGVPA